MVCDVNDKATLPNETTVTMSNIPWKKLKQLVKLGIESKAMVSIYWTESGACSLMITPPDEPKVTVTSSPTWPTVTPMYYPTDHPIREDGIKITCNTSANQEDTIVRDIMVGKSTEV